MTDMEIPQAASLALAAVVAEANSRGNWETYSEVTRERLTHAFTGVAERGLTSALPHLLTEVKSMCETAGEFGRLLGRKEAGEEIAEAIERVGGERSTHRGHERSAVSRLGSVRHASYLDAATIARNLSPRVPGAVPNGLTASSRHPGTPEDTKPPQEGCKRCRGYGYIPDWTNWDTYHDEPRPKPCPECAAPPAPDLPEESDQ